jgi:hypothetical protein
MKDKVFLPFIVIGFLMALVAMPLISQLPAINPKFNFILDEPGKIASTINNFKAPFIGQLSTILLYRALMAQVLSNRLQRQEHNSQIVEYSLSDIEKAN